MMSVWELGLWGRAISCSSPWSEWKSGAGNVKVNVNSGAFGKPKTDLCVTAVSQCAQYAGVEGAVRGLSLQPFVHG